MGMSVDFHLDNNESKVELSHRVAESYGQNYGTFSVKGHGGHESQEVTFYLNLEQIQEMKKELAKLERNLKKEIEKSIPPVQMF